MVSLVHITLPTYLPTSILSVTRDSISRRQPEGRGKRGGIGDEEVLFFCVCFFKLYIFFICNSVQGRIDDGSLDVCVRVEGPRDDDTQDEWSVD